MHGEHQGAREIMQSRGLYLALAALFLSAARVSSYGQAEPAGIGPTGFRFDVGAGVSENLMDFSPGSRMVGVSAWADWHCFMGGRWLSRAALDFEGRDVNFMHPSGLSKLRADTAQGGIKFTLLAGGKGRLYVKGLGGLGSADFPPLALSSGTHRTAMIYSYGEGFDWRFSRIFSLNVDLETQQWRSLFPDNSAWTPTAITVGISHSFAHSRHQRPAYVLQ
jgi:hypothetical protein